MEKTILDRLEDEFESSNNNEILEPTEEELLKMEKNIVAFEIHSDLSDKLVGIYLRQINKMEAVKRMKIKQGVDSCENFNDIVESNLRLVFGVAKKHVGRGLSFSDLIQEGNLGLIKGIMKFQPSKGFKLSTYVLWWIRQFVERSIIDQGKMIRVPVHRVDDRRKILETTRILNQKLGREPNIEEIAQYVGFSIEKIANIMKIPSDPISLDDPIEGYENLIRQDLVCDEMAVDSENAAILSELSEKVEKALFSLKPREEKVIRMRFGIGYPRAYLLEEIGQEFGVTRERIRQIEAKALKKLKHPSRSKRLEFFV